MIQAPTKNCDPQWGHRKFCMKTYLVGTRQHLLEGEMRDVRRSQLAAEAAAHLKTVAKSIEMTLVARTALMQLSGTRNRDCRSAHRRPPPSGKHRLLLDPIFTSRDDLKVSPDQTSSQRVASHSCSSVQIV